MIHTQYTVNQSINQSMDFILIQFKHRFQVFRCFSECSLENQGAPVGVRVLIERKRV